MALTNFKNGQILTETEMNKIVTEVNAKATKEELNTKASKTVASGSADGLMSSADKTKLDGIAASANNYVHPSKHDASVITETEEKRFVSDTEKATWNAKAANTVATGQANGLMSSADKKKLDGIAAGANNYTHPSGAGNNHIPSGGSANKVLKWSADGVAVWGDDKDTTYTNATQDAAGLMSAEDKKKLNGIASQANNYVHPDDSETRHVTDAEKSKWNKMSEGLHVPPVESYTDTARYLRNDNTWQTIMPAYIGAKDYLGIGEFTLDGNDGTNSFTVTIPISETTGGSGQAIIYISSKREESNIGGVYALAVSYIATGQQPTIQTQKTIALYDSTNDKHFRVLPLTRDDDGLHLEIQYVGDRNRVRVAIEREGLGVEYFKMKVRNIRHVSSITGKYISPSNDLVSQTTDGIMSYTDKVKLDGIEAQANNYVHPTNDGNKHIPSGGSAGQILRWSEAGTAVWGADNNTTYNVVSKTANGLAPQLPNEEGTTKYLRQDGTWVVPPDTKYVAATEQALGLVKKMPTQADSTAQELAGLVSDFNALLAKLKAAGIMS